MSHHNRHGGHGGHRTGHGIGHGIGHIANNLAHNVHHTPPIHHSPHHVPPVHHVPLTHHHVQPVHHHVPPVHHHASGGDLAAALLVGGALGAGVTYAATQPSTTTYISQPTTTYVPQPPTTTTSIYMQQPVYSSPTQTQQPYYYPTNVQQNQYNNTVSSSSSSSLSTQQTQLETKNVQSQYPTQQYSTQTQTQYPTQTQYQTKSQTTSLYQDNANYYGEGSTVKKETQSTQKSSDLPLYQPINPYYGMSNNIGEQSTSTSVSTNTSSSIPTTTSQNQIINPFYVYGDLKQTTGESEKPSTTSYSTEEKKEKVSEEGVVVYQNPQQPLLNCKPSLVSTVSSYSDEDALEDAKKLRAAMKGIGCDSNVISEITGSRTHQQRLQIKKMYVKVEEKERNLLKDLDSELSGDFKKTVMFLYADPGARDAHWMKDAVEGRGYNADLLLEILCTRTNEEIEKMKEAWTKIEKGSLVKRMNEETSKLFSAGHFQTFCAKLLEANRPQDTATSVIDDKEVMADAEHLNRALTQDKKGEAKTVFVNIFTQRSWRHIAAISGKFEQVSKKYTLDTAIKQEWGSSDTGKGLRIILEFVTSPYDFWAKKLQASMAGLGTDDSTLRRIIISRCEIDLRNVAEIFGERYGKGKTLRSWIEDDTSGHYRKLLLKLCGY